MEPSSVRTTWLCFAVLCSGAAFALNGEELRHQSTTKGVHVPETMGDPTTTTEDEGKLMTWPMATLTPLVTEVPVITLVPTQADAAENKTRSQDQVAPTSDSSDLGALDPLPIQDTIPIIPAPQEERKGLEKTPEDTETNFSEPSPPVVPQPDTPTAAGGLRCPGELEAD
ncbi:mucin-2-like [Patagioenas fasciata monilis]|uniref:Mucin-2-like n=1 Tax=Patagioenas fasciata monilis TaxID=372326 RepID=A0A1V4L1K0_PATFA|nr:mucin-2-like [Patagioenas fasciata monilis]